MTGEASPPEDKINEIRISDLKRLGIDNKNQLYWDGRRVEVRQRLNLTRLQTFAAIVVSIAAILGGLGGFFSGFTDASAFLCARGLHWLSCPPPAR